MADEITHGPNVIHPETASAVGSRNSLNRHNRDEYAEARLMVDEEVDKILNHIHAKLPPEVAMRLDVSGSVKSKLHTYYNQSYQNMLNRYLVTMEDEMGKKVRDLVDVEEMRSLNRYTPRSISYLLDRIGGADQFHTGEVERSIVNMLGHLHGHVQREMNDLETSTNSLLRRKTDVGAFVRGENAYAIVKCSFRDHADKPSTVMQVKLSLNILDNEMISPIFPYMQSTAAIVKDMVSKRVTDALEKEIAQIDERQIDEGKSELNSEEKIFERIKALDQYVSDEEQEGSRRYAIIPKKFFDAIEGLEAEIASADFDALGVRENVFRVIEEENIRNRGYNTAVNSITHVLDWSRMGYQHIENLKGARKCIIREYADTKVHLLPDERYQLELSYYDASQIAAFREAYTSQMADFERTVMELWRVVEIIYDDSKAQTGRDDWESFSARVLGQNGDRPSWLARVFSAGGEEEDLDASDGPREKLWNELTFVPPEEVGAVGENPTMEDRLTDLKVRFPKMKERVAFVFGNDSPELRDVVEGRMEFLEDEFGRFSSLINPFHLQPGVLLDVDITSIKRKSSTMMNMANVLNEFLHSMSAGFADAAFASFSRRRSTQTDDTGEFASATGTAEMVGEPQGEEVFD